MRVSQLAKELGKESKDIVALLEKNGIEKKAQSGLEASEEEMVRKAFGKAEPKKEETPVAAKEKQKLRQSQNRKHLQRKRRLFL